MKAPHLSHELILEREEATPDGLGGYGRSWQAVARVWAMMRASGARDAASAEEGALRPLWQITLRSGAAGAGMRPRAGQRLRMMGAEARIFTILSLAEKDPEGRWLLCHCREEERP